MKYLYKDVPRIPKELEPGVVYVNPEFELGALLCACGCGHRVDLLVPDGHRVTCVNDLATIRPSVGALDSLCKSHYVITEGVVEWLPPFREEEAKLIMARQIARHAEADYVEQEPWYIRWPKKLWAFIFR